MMWYLLDLESQNLKNANFQALKVYFNMAIVVTVDEANQISGGWYKIM